MKAIVLYLLIISSILSCSENEDNTRLVEQAEDSLMYTSKGTIQKYGNIDEGDCGFIIEILDTLYKPLNLSSEYEITNITVKIKYKLLDSILSCGDINVSPYHRELQIIEIIEIEKLENEADSSILEGIGIVNKYGNENEGDCGFILKFNDSLYKPTNLDESFKINALQVFVKFELLDSIFICGEIPKPPYHRELEKIKIIEIKTE